MLTEPDIFIVPVTENFLIYAPLHHFTALVDRRAAQQIRAGLCSENVSLTPVVQPIVDRLRRTTVLPLKARSGPLTNPLFLGLIPTRGCNMGCVYCDFAAPKTTSETMDLNLAREAVNAYMGLLVENGYQHAEVHFFGGEPFYAEEVVHFVVGYATMRAAELGLDVRFEATSNGLYSADRAHWIADFFDSVVLSLDGPSDIQNRNRPGLNGRGVFDVVMRTAKIFSERTVELILRSCITKDSVSRLPDIAEWIARELHPSVWCVETLTDSPLSASVGLELPDPWEFARSFDIASRILAEYGVKIVNSTTDIGQCRITFCPVGQDALIISPDGFIDACYLLDNAWSQKGLNMRFGRVNISETTESVTKKDDVSIKNGQALLNSLNQVSVIVENERIVQQPILEVDNKALQAVRNLNVYNRSLCANCLCRYSCTGGCHVNHDTSAAPGNFDRLCIQTRLITIANLLKKMGQYDLVTEWFSDPTALTISVWQTTDRIKDVELSL